MPWSPDIETLPRERLEALQRERLAKLLSRLHESVPHYRQVLDQAGWTAADFRTLEDLSRLPFTTKSDLRDHYPFGLLAVPREEIVRVHASSGTTGKPTVVGYTRGDMDLWAEVMARTLTAGEVSPSDVVHNAYGYGLFTGGLGLALGSETIGAATVPISGGFTRRQLMLMEDLGATVLCCTPSYALVLAESAEEAGIDPARRLKLRAGFFGAEPWSDAIRSEIEARLRIEAFDLYGLSEIIGPGVAFECSEHDGLHVSEDHFFPEVVDPVTGQPRPSGSEGELVLTTLTREAIPLLRYRTRDRVRLVHEPCSCGRTLARMSRLLGRTDDMLIIRGVNVFPSQIEEAVLKVDGLTPNYVILVNRQKDHLDELEVWVEASDETHRRGDFRMREVQTEALDRIKETLGISVRVRIVDPRRIERSQGKAMRVIDRREMEPS